MQKILVAFDFSDNSIEALRYALGISKEYKATIFVLHVYNLPPFERYIEHAILEEFSENKLAEKLRKFIEENVLTNSEIGKDIDIQYIMKNGPTSKEIIATSKELNPMLIIMGASGMNGISKFLWGSNTQKVIKKGNSPVLVIPQNKVYSRIKSVAFATDFNVEDFEIINSLIRFCEIIKAKLNCVHIKNSDSEWDQPTINYMKDRYKKELESGRVNIELVKNYDVVEGIQNYISENNIDLLTMLREERNIFEKIFDKSETKTLSVESEIPVLIFKEH